MSYNHCIDFAFVFNSEYSVPHYHVQRRAAEASMITAEPMSASGNALRCTIFTKPTGGGHFVKYQSTTVAVPDVPRKKLVLVHFLWSSKTTLGYSVFDLVGLNLKWQHEPGGPSQSRWGLATP